MKFQKSEFLAIAEQAICEGVGQPASEVALEIYLRVTGDHSGQISAARKAKGLSQAELGRLLGVDQVQVSRWERGLHRPSDDTLKKIQEVTR